MQRAFLMSGGLVECTIAMAMNMTLTLVYYVAAGIVFAKLILQILRNQLLSLQKETSLPYLPGGPPSALPASGGRGILPYEPKGILCKVT